MMAQSNGMFYEGILPKLCPLTSWTWSQRRQQRQSSWYNAHSYQLVIEGQCSVHSKAIVLISPAKMCIKGSKVSGRSFKHRRNSRGSTMKPCWVPLRNIPTDLAAYVDSRELMRKECYNPSHGFTKRTPYWESVVRASSSVMRPRKPQNCMATERNPSKNLTYFTILLFCG